MGRDVAMAYRLLCPRGGDSRLAAYGGYMLLMWLSLGLMALCEASRFAAAKAAPEIDGATLSALAVAAAAAAAANAVRFCIEAGRIEGEVCAGVDAMVDALSARFFSGCSSAGDFAAEYGRCMDSLMRGAGPGEEREENGGLIRRLAACRPLLEKRFS